MIIHGDALTELRKLPDESVNCCVTSPPYWGLRDYGTAKWEGGDPGCDHSPTPEQIKKAVMGASGLGDHHAAQEEAARSRMMPKSVCPKCGAVRIDSQLGLEKTPEEYVGNLVAVFREVKRVLRGDGTLWLNLGDSYAAQPAGNKTPSGFSQTRPSRISGNGDQETVVLPKRETGLKPKDLVGIPWRVAFALQADGWYLRSDIIWAKPNPMPESVRDRPTRSHEYIFLMSKNARYWYDAEAIEEKTNDLMTKPRSFRKSGAESVMRNDIGQPYEPRGTRNRRSVWTVATRPYAEAHFATFPPDLIEPCIKAGCPAKICAKCGEPWKRMLEKGERIQAHWDGTTQNHAIAAKGRHGKTSVIETGSYQTYKTIGFVPTCSCNAGQIGGTVLDPFFGAGTTGLVALRLGREFIGIELNEKYCEMAKRRIYGPLQIGATA